MTTKTKERSIVLYDWEVQAILAGRKTQLRRVVKAKDADESRCIGLATLLDCVTEWREQDGRWFGIDGYETLVYADCPFGKPGERLWGKESVLFRKGMFQSAQTCATFVCFRDGSQKFKNGEYKDASVQWAYLVYESGAKQCQPPPEVKEAIERQRAISEIGGSQYFIDAGVLCKWFDETFGGGCENKS